MARRLWFQIILLGLLLCPPVGAEEGKTTGESGSPARGTLIIHITGFLSDEGQALIAVHNTPKTFLKRTAPFERAMVPISGKEVSYTFEKIPHGRYAVAVFHDENQNEDLDGNFLGIPKERFGFSNNARRKFGPPKYKEAEFEFAVEQLTLDIRVATPFEKWKAAKCSPGSDVAGCD